MSSAAVLRWGKIVNESGDYGAECPSCHGSYYWQRYSGFCIFCGHGLVCPACASPNPQVRKLLEREPCQHEYHEQR